MSKKAMKGRVPVLRCHFSEPGLVQAGMGVTGKMVLKLLD
jgi:hypothetical protein